MGAMNAGPVSTVQDSVGLRAHIVPLLVDSLRNRHMPILSLSSHGSTPHERLLGHNPDVLSAWLELERAFFESPAFSADFREQVRRALAFGNRCEYCMHKAGPPDRSRADRRLQLALAFADMVSRDHRAIDPSQIAVLKADFTDAEIAELLAFACFISASQMFGALMGLRASDLPHVDSTTA